jgi:hypothetical protein
MRRVLIALIPNRKPAALPGRSDLMSDTALAVVVIVSITVAVVGLLGLYLYARRQVNRTIDKYR